MNPLITRILSAIVAICLLISLVYFLGDDGLRFLCVIAVILGRRELSRILFRSDDPKLLKFVFNISLLLVFFGFAYLPSDGTLVFCLISIFFCCLSLMSEKTFSDLDNLVSFISKSILGFLYVGLLPGMAFHLIGLPNGSFWFFTLLGCVLFGDTFAYLAGMSFGKNKLSPRISPKKTIEGSFGGLAGSVLAGILSVHYFMPQIPMIYMILLCLMTGFVAQQGDLFESLLKRLANRKDSGSIMPGHGGILDRIDGILFGAPIFYAGAVWLPAFIGFIAF